MDSIPRLNRYAKQMQLDTRNWWLLTGDRDEIYTLARRSYFADEATGYNKNNREFLHTENCVLVDGKGRIRGIYNATLELEMEKLIRHDLRIWPKTTELADQVGVSVRTLQSATQAICGMSPHRYSRVLRLWSVRRQLRTGPAGRSVKSCAIAHGFWHLSEFAASYRAAFGELPSETLYRSLRGE